MVSLTLRNSTEQTFAPYEDDPESGMGDRVRLLGNDPSSDLLSDDGLEDQLVSKKQSPLRQILAKAGSVAVGIGKLRKKRDGVKRKIGCLHICGILCVLFVIWIIVTVSKVDSASCLWLTLTSSGLDRRLRWSGLVRTRSSLFLSRHL